MALSQLDLTKQSYGRDGNYTVGCNAAMILVSYTCKSRFWSVYCIL